MDYVGTAGWNVPRTSAGHFPERGSHLQRYGKRLNCVEINSSFYRPHSRSTYERWAASVPLAFRFAVKVPRSITHECGLRRTRVPLQRFLDEIKGLGKKLGPLLIQLPPSFAYDVKVTGRFLALLRGLYRGAVVLEPRHRSWFASGPNRLLAKYRIGRAGVDPAPDTAASTPSVAHGGIRYYRLHGSPRMYWSAYSLSYLRALAGVTKTQRRRGTTWVVFDNTAAGCATANALQLKAMLRT